MIKKNSRLKINDTAWFETRVEKKFGVEIENKSEKIWWTVFEKNGWSKKTMIWCLYKRIDGVYGNNSIITIC